MSGHGKARTELSKRNKYYISKHRRLELIHFCLQYPEWERSYHALEYPVSSIQDRDGPTPEQEFLDPTGNAAVARAMLADKMRIVWQASMEADKEIGSYIFKAVTEGLSFINLKTKTGIPCEKDMFYDRYHKFFWVLSRMKS